jgi:hypothetical protein
MSVAVKWLSVDLRHTVCCHKGCGAVIAMPREEYDWFLSNPGEGFYCYYGHRQWFTGKSKEQKLKDQLERERRRTQEARDRADNERLRAETLRRSRNAYKGKLKATKNRIKNGVCPCCKRTFKNLARHMAGQHPGYADKASH